MPTVTATGSTGARPEVRIGGGEIHMTGMQVVKGKDAPRVESKDQYVKREVAPHLKGFDIAPKNGSGLWAPKK